jgi:hypothetical protein
MIEAFSRTQQRLQFIDVSTAMLDAEGQPRRELFRTGGLHFNPQGYALWTSIVKPVLLSRFGLQSMLSRSAKRNETDLRLSPMSCVGESLPAPPAVNSAFAGWFSPHTLRGPATHRTHLSSVFGFSCFDLGSNSTSSKVQHVPHSKQFRDTAAILPKTRIGRSTLPFSQMGSHS